MLVSLLILIISTLEHEFKDNPTAVPVVGLCFFWDLERPMVECVHKHWLIWGIGSKEDKGDNFVRDFNDDFWKVLEEEDKEVEEEEEEDEDEGDDDDDDDEVKDSICFFFLFWIYWLIFVL